ncbi:MAG: Catalase [Solirubrobacterales bacterium]|nr:Catalase [Solirubrobacterales bacterium]
MSEQRSVPTTTTDAGMPAAVDDHPLAVGLGGPTALQDACVVQPLQPVNRERVPERVVHDAGSGAAGFPDPTDDWSERVETWASNAQSAPKSDIPEEGPRMTLTEVPPAPEANGPKPTPTDRAVQAGERLLEATGKVGNTYADAYEEAVISLADFRENLADASPVDWSKRVPHSGTAGARAFGDPMGEAAGTAMALNEQVLAAGKKLGLAYIDACEQAMLAAVELSEEAANASDNPLMRSLGSTPAGVARDATKAYFDMARGLLG